MTVEVDDGGVGTDKFKRYAVKAIGSLDRYLMRKSRESATAVVKLKRVDRSHGNKYEVRVTLKTPSFAVDEKDSTLNGFAALDIVKAKLAIELKNRTALRLPERQKRV